MGNICKTLLESGVKLGVSSRGSGNVNDNGIVKDFEIITVDIVANPSAPDAFVDGIMEGKEWVWEGGMLREKACEGAKREINTLVDDKMLEANKLRLFANFLSEL